MKHPTRSLATSSGGLGTGDMELLEQVQRSPQKRSEGWNPSAVRKG